MGMAAAKAGNPGGWEHLVLTFPRRLSDRKKLPRVLPPLGGGSSPQSSLPMVAEGSRVAAGSVQHLVRALASFAASISRMSGGEDRSVLKRVAHAGQRQSTGVKDLNHSKVDELHGYASLIRDQPPWSTVRSPPDQITQVRRRLEGRPYVHTSQNTTYISQHICFKWL